MKSMQKRKLMTHKNRILAIVVALILLAATIAVGAGGCGTTGTAIAYDCNYPMVGRLGHDGLSDACCHVDPCPCHCLNDPCPDESEKACDAGVPEGGSSSCSGECVPALPLGGWEGPSLLWLGPEGMEPACPEQAPVVAYQGHDGLLAAPISCGACACSTPVGSCALPLSLTASSTHCGDSSGVTSSFNGPAAWDGACTDKDCIGQPPACTQSLSAQSLTAAPLVLTEQGCTPTTLVPQDLGTASWSTAALACRGMPTKGFGCDDPGQICAAFATPPEFTMCLYHEGEASCPDSYPVKHVVYTGVDDQRTCSDCACGAPGGGLCTGTLNVFKDEACSVPLLSDPLSSSGPACFDLVPAGLPLGSKTVEALAYQEGSCMPSGGEALGAVEAPLASTFCCLIG